MSGNTNAPWRNEELLRQKYWEEGLSSVEMAEEWGCTKACVLKWMRKNGVERRKPKPERPPQARIGNHGYWTIKSKYDGKDDHVLIHRLIAVAEYGFDEVGEKQVHHSNGFKIDNRPSNLELVTDWQHKAAHSENSEAPWQDKKKMEEGLENHTQTKLAEMWGCNQSMISRWKHRLGLVD